MTVSEICKKASTNRNWGKVIFGLVSEFQPNNCLELGTSLGISAMYQSVAMNNHSHPITIEGIAQLAEISAKELQKINKSTKVINGRFDTVLDDLLPLQEWIDFVFIDGHHEQVAAI